MPRPATDYRDLPAPGRPTPLHVPQPFPTGEINLTPLARQTLADFAIDHEPMLQRHTNADWGDIGHRNWQHNNRQPEFLPTKTRLPSGHSAPPKTAVTSLYNVPVDQDTAWAQTIGFVLRTEWHRKTTTIMLLQEYQR